MSKSPSENPNPAFPQEVPPSALRHTQSHRYDSQGSKKKKTAYASPITSIMESENSDDELEKGVQLRLDKSKSAVVYENERKTSKGATVKPKIKEGNPRSVGVENPAFEGSIHSKRSSTATSSRAPSVQSLEIVREQYCCCAKRTRCERRLLIVIIILTIIIIVLIVVMVFVAKRDEINDLRSTFSL